MALQSWLERLEIEPDGTTKPFEVTPPRVFYLHSRKDVQSFPNCCEVHLKSFQEAKIWAIDFMPEGDSDALARKIVLNLAYTEFYLKSALDQDDWYEDISDYIEFNIFSFGSSIKHSEHYLLKLFGLIKAIQNPSTFFKLEKLSTLSFFWFKNSICGRDLFHMRKAFDKWFHSFPFDLSFLQGLKDKYDLFFGIVNDDFFDLDDTSFMTELNKLTDAILTNYNTSILSKQGKLTDPSKLKLDLIESQRTYQLTNENLYGQDSENDPEYKRMIRKWFEDEKIFLDDIISLGNSSSPGEQPPSEDMSPSSSQSKKDELSTKSKLGNTQNSKAHVARGKNKPDGYSLNQICIALYCMHLSKESPDAKILLKKYYGNENPASLKNHNIVSKSQFISLENLDKDKWKKDDLQKVLRIVTSENHSIGIEKASQYWREFWAAYTKHYKTDND